MDQKPIRIAFVIDTIFEPTGGSETQLLALLERLDRSRFDPHLFCLRSSQWLEREGGALPWTDLRIAVSPRPSLLRHVRDFARVLREGGFEIVQTHFRDANVAGVLAAHRAGVPCIVSTRRGVPYWHSAPELWLLRRLDRLPTWFVANSQATKERFTRAEGIDPTRMDVIYNGLDASRFVALDPERRERLRAELGLGGSRGRVVGLVGNLRPVKGIDVFVRAARLVLERHPDTRFVVVGQGPQEQTLRALVAELGLEARVHLVGVRRDVPDVLQLFDVGVLASRFESFSNSILEYLAAGLAVVVTDVGGAREVVRPGENGFLVPSDDPSAIASRVVELLDHAEGPRAWVKGSGLDDRFSMRTMVRAHEDVYERQLAWAERVGRRRVSRV